MKQACLGSIPFLCVCMLYQLHCFIMQYSKRIEEHEMYVNFFVLHSFLLNHCLVRLTLEALCLPN